MADDDLGKRSLPAKPGKTTGAKPASNGFVRRVKVVEPGLDGFSCAILMPLYGRVPDGAVLPAGVDFVSEERALVATAFRKSVAQVMGDDGIVHRSQFLRKHVPLQELLTSATSATTTRISRVLSKRSANAKSLA